MWIRRLCLAAVLLLVCVPAWGATSIELQQSNGTKTVLGGEGDAAKVVMDAPAGVTGTATEAAPTLAEASTGYFSWDLNGNLRISQGTLTSGEDQTNNLLMTSGGAVRQTIVASGITTNTTSAANTIFTGPKSLYGQVDGTGALTATLEIWGGPDSTASTTNKKLVCTLTLSGTTTADDVCPPTTANFSFYVVKSLSVTGTGATAKALAFN